MSPRILTLSAFFAVVAGCTMVGPKYEERPVTDILLDSTITKDTRKGALPNVVETDMPEIDKWWERFNDDALTRLIAKAFDANRTLEAARANLRAAREVWKYQRGGLYPTVDATGGINRNRSSKNSISGKNDYTDYRVSGDAKWEIDFFGRTQHLVDAAAAEAEAAEADLQAAWVSLSSEVALRYIELRTLQGRLMIAEDTLGVQEANVKLLTDRSAGGISTDLERIQAEYDLQTTAAVIPSLKAQIAATENVLALLCGVTPGTLPAEIVSPKFPQKETSELGEDGGPRVIALRTTSIPRPKRLPMDAGIPAHAISNRPDVIAAERTLKAAVDTVGSAEAERYPRIFISGSIGLNSIHMSDLVDWDSHFYNFGPGISLPIFHGGQINANIKIKTEQQKAALAVYEETVLTALADIRTALTGYAYEEERLGHLREGVNDAATAYNIAYNAYTAGKLRFFEVLDAQRRLFTLDESRVISEGAMAQAQVNLYKALCGGWTPDKSDEELAAYFFGTNAPSEPLLAPIGNDILEEPVMTDKPIDGDVR